MSAGRDADLSLLRRNLMTSFADRLFLGDISRAAEVEFLEAGVIKLPEPKINRVPVPEPKRLRKAAEPKWKN